MLPAASHRVAPGRLAQQWGEWRKVPCEQLQSGPTIRSILLAQMASACSQHASRPLLGGLLPAVPQQGRPRPPGALRCEPLLPDLSSPLYVKSCGSDQHQWLPARLKASSRGPAACRTPAGSPQAAWGGWRKVQVSCCCLVCPCQIQHQMSTSAMQTAPAGSQHSLRPPQDSLLPVLPSWFHLGSRVVCKKF